MTKEEAYSYVGDTSIELYNSEYEEINVMIIDRIFDHFEAIIAEKDKEKEFIYNLAMSYEKIITSLSERIKELEAQLEEPIAEIHGDSLYDISKQFDYKLCRMENKPYKVKIYPVKE